jgi:hypothetical protein
MIRFAVPCLLVAALCATTTSASEQRAGRSGQAKLQRALKGLSPGAAQRCLSRDRVTELRGFEGEILYVGGRNRVWRNHTVGHCNGLARGDIIVTNTIGRDYCSGDIVQTRERTGGALTGSCSLGEFVPYTKGGSR